MSIEATFGRIGARVRVRRAVGDVREADRGGRRLVRVHTPPAPVAIDVLRDRRGEFFDVAVSDDVRVEVLDSDARDRHLLLLARIDGEKARFLCGHDERHWFVAAVPESRPISTVRAAKDALRPPAAAGTSWVRQGEWFFVPAPAFEPGPLEPIRRFEPIVRSGGGTPHVAAEAVRTGGTTVYVPQIPWVDGRDRERDEQQRQFGRGVTEARMRVLRRANPRWRWGTMLRDPDLYVRGAVRHPDHATVTLRGWHRVLMNTESQAKAMAHVVFLD